MTLRDYSDSLQLLQHYLQQHDIATNSSGPFASIDAKNAKALIFTECKTLLYSDSTPEEMEQLWKSGSIRNTIELGNPEGLMGNYTTVGWNERSGMMALNQRLDERLSDSERIDQLVDNTVIMFLTNYYKKNSNRNETLTNNLLLAIRDEVEKNHLLSGAKTLLEEMEDADLMLVLVRRGLL